MTRLVDRPNSPRSVHVLIVGVADYGPSEPTDFDALPGIVRSVERAAGFWMGSDGLLVGRKLATVDVLLSAGSVGTVLRSPRDEAPEPATFNNVRAAFHRWVNSCSEKADTLAILHWLGHGEAEIETTRPNTPAISLFCGDVQQLTGAAPIRMGVSFSRTVDSLRRLPFAGDALCFVDACRKEPSEPAEDRKFESAVPIPARGQDRTGSKLACYTVAYDGVAAFCREAGSSETGFRGGAVLTEAVLDALAHYGGREMVGKGWLVDAWEVAEAVNARIDWWRQPLALPDSFKVGACAPLKLPLVWQQQPRCMVSIKLPASAKAPPAAELAESGLDECDHFNGDDRMPATAPLHRFGRTFLGDVEPSTGWCPVASGPDASKPTKHNGHVCAIPPSVSSRWTP